MGLGPSRVTYTVHDLSYFVNSTLGVPLTVVWNDPEYISAWQYIGSNHSGLLEAINFILENPDLQIHTTLMRFQNAIYCSVGVIGIYSQLVWRYIYECYIKAGSSPEAPHMKEIEMKTDIRRPLFTEDPDFPDVIEGIIICSLLRAERGIGEPKNKAVFKLELSNELMFNYQEQSEQLIPLYKDAIAYFRNLSSKNLPIKLWLYDVTWETEQIISRYAWNVVMTVSYSLVPDYLPNKKPKLTIVRRA